MFSQLPGRTHVNLARFCRPRCLVIFLSRQYIMNLLLDFALSLSFACLLALAETTNTPEPIALQASQFWYVSTSSYP